MSQTLQGISGNPSSDRQLQFLSLSMINLVLGCSRSGAPKHTNGAILSARHSLGMAVSMAVIAMGARISGWYNCGETLCHLTCTNMRCLLSSPTWRKAPSKMPKRGMHVSAVLPRRIMTKAGNPPSGQRLNLRSSGPSCRAEDLIRLEQSWNRPCSVTRSSATVRGRPKASATSPVRVKKAMGRLHRRHT